MPADSLFQLENAITGMGRPGHDPAAETRVTGPSGGFLLDQEQEERYYRGFKICRKVCDLIPSQMGSAWCRLKMGGENGDPALLEAMEQTMREMPVQTLMSEYKGVAKAFQVAQQFANRSGNGAIILIANDGETDYAEPLNLDNLRSIEELRVLDRWSLVPEMQHFGRSPYYRLIHFPLLYDNKGRLMTRRSLIHKTRVLWFRGEELPDNALMRTGGCDDSVLGAFLRPFLRKEVGTQGAARMLEDFDVYVHKITGLLSKMDVKEEEAAGARQKIMTRLRINKLSKSIWNGIAIDKDHEELDHWTRAVSGYSDLLQQIYNDMLAATDLQPSELLNQYPQGLNATGKVEQENINLRTRYYQSEKWESQLYSFLQLLWLCRNGKSHGTIPGNYSIEWLDRYPTTPLDQSALELNRAQIDQTNIAAGLYSGEEAALSHYGGSEYNPNITIDFAKRAALAQGMVEPVESEETAENFSFEDYKIDAFPPAALTNVARGALKKMDAYSQAIARGTLLKVSPIVRAIAGGQPLTQQQHQDAVDLWNTHGVAATEEATTIRMLLGDRVGRDWLMGTARRDSRVKAAVNQELRRLYMDAETLQVKGKVIEEYPEGYDLKESEEQWRKHAPDKYEEIIHADAEEKARTSPPRPGLVKKKITNVQREEQTVWVREGDEDKKGDKGKPKAEKKEKDKPTDEDPKKKKTAPTEEEQVLEEDPAAAEEQAAPQISFAQRSALMAKQIWDSEELPPNEEILAYSGEAIAEFMKNPVQRVRDWIKREQLARDAFKLRYGVDAPTHSAVAKEGLKKAAGALKKLATEEDAILGAVGLISSTVAGAAVGQLTGMHGAAVGAGIAADLVSVAAARKVLEASNAYKSAIAKLRGDEAFEAAKGVKRLQLAAGATLSEMKAPEMQQRIEENLVGDVGGWAIGNAVAQVLPLPASGAIAAAATVPTVLVPISKAAHAKVRSGVSPAEAIMTAVTEHFSAPSRKEQMIRKKTSEYIRTVKTLGGVLSEK